MRHTVRSLVAIAVATLALPLVAGGAPPAGAATARPTCIVSLSPTATATLFAIGAGSQVKAVDDDANYPSGLPTTRINALDPSVEAVLGVCPATASRPSGKPDLVIVSYDANDIVAKLENVGVKVVEQDAPTTLAGAYAQISQLGRLTGHAAKASATVAKMKAEITASFDSVPAHPGKVLTVYYELDPTYYSLASNTFVGSILKKMGVTNIADAKSTSADAGYPQLSAEYIVSADPKLIFLADTICCHASAVTVAKRPGFSTISAVVHHHVVGLNDDVASQWGTRLPILVADLAAGVRATLADPSVW